MSSETIRLIAELLLPPGGILILLVFGLLLWLFRQRKSAATCITLGIAMMYFASAPFIADQIFDSLQYKHKALNEIPAEAQAIVVLANGRLPIAREYDNLDTVNAESLERLRYAASLAKKSELPILLVGGSVYNEHLSMAAVMQKVLATDYGLQAKWLEEESKNTLENAKYTKNILDENSISNFLLVTHAYHMSRSMRAFKTVGLNPTAAPTVFYKESTGIPEYKNYIPNAYALTKTRRAVKEYLAKLWYHYFET